MKRIGFPIFICQRYFGEGTYHGHDIRIDGFCKKCGKDIQKNSMLCEDCRKEQNKLFLKKGKQYIAQRINQVESCCICGKKLNREVKYFAFDYSYQNYSKYHFNSVSEAEQLLANILDEFKYHDPQKFLIEHHICYYEYA